MRPLACSQFYRDGREGINFVGRRVRITEQQVNSLSWREALEWEWRCGWKELIRWVFVSDKRCWREEISQSFKDSWQPSGNCGVDCGWLGIHPMWRKILIWVGRVLKPEWKNEVRNYSVEILHHYESKIKCQTYLKWFGWMNKRLRRRVKVVREEGVNFEGFLYH